MPLRLSRVRTRGSLSRLRYPLLVGLLGCVVVACSGQPGPGDRDRLFVQPTTMADLGPTEWLIPSVPEGYQRAEPLSTDDQISVTYDPTESPPRRGRRRRQGVPRFLFTAQPSASPDQYLRVLDVDVRRRCRDARWEEIPDESDNGYRVVLRWIICGENSDGNGTISHVRIIDGELGLWVAKYKVTFPAFRMDRRLPMRRREIRALRQFLDGTVVCVDGSADHPCPYVDDSTWKMEWP